MASLAGVDLALIVTEPTVSGVHDLVRVLQLAAHFKVKVQVVINKADLNLQQAERIEHLAAQYGAHVIGRIPFDPAVNNALSAGKTIVEYGNSPAAQAVRKIWTEMCKILAAIAILCCGMLCFPSLIWSGK